MQHSTFLFKSAYNKFNRCYTQSNLIFINLVLALDNQAINNLFFMYILGKSHYNIITFQFQVNYKESIILHFNYNKANYVALNSKLGEITYGKKWYNLFKKKIIALSWQGAGVINEQDFDICTLH